MNTLIRNKKLSKKRIQAIKRLIRIKCKKFDKILNSLSIKVDINRQTRNNKLKGVKNGKLKRKNAQDRDQEYCTESG